MTEKVFSPEKIALFHEKIAGADAIAISGHTNPDGDCVGACLGLCTYIRDEYPEKTVDVLLEPVMEKFRFLKHAEEIRQESGREEPYDLYLSLDCSDLDRLKLFREEFGRAKYRICVDHHKTNQGFGDILYLDGDASSTCEILYRLFDETKISVSCAEALYMGIAHDTGVFKHSNTTRNVMEIAGALIEKGAHPERIIDDTFYKKTYAQNQILGRVLMESILLLDGRMIFSALSKKDMDFYGAGSGDLDGVIDQLRVTQGVECALFLYENAPQTYKVSMRSNEKVDVARIAFDMGGGGHVRAAGCTAYGEVHDIVNYISAQVEEQLDRDGEA